MGPKVSKLRTRRNEFGRCTGLAGALSGNRHQPPLITSYCILIVCAESRVKLTENQVKMTTSIRIAMAACTMTIT